MFNYYSLNDVEFENLCQNVMERMLSVELRTFSKGRDGGIDLTDNISKPHIIVQVKHYIKSKFANLRTSLKSEIEKVKKWNPDEYHLCCGMELTLANIKEVYDMFSDYMTSDRNIITLLEIDTFLQKPENADIVRKHYKLWLHASGILNQINNQNIFIDCEALLSEIHEESKYFVQTSIYNQCLDCLDDYRMIMITGQPGVGKTITSKMLALYYASQGYSIRYTSNGNISDIKKSLSLDKSVNELVLLDDCLGQHYFKMKDSQENELTSLAQYVKLHKNKKLILNSRITILNEAKERCESFNLFLEEKKINKLTIDMDMISRVEKAKIFYNHLISKRIPENYYENIKENKNYLNIVLHTNYTPRIIEYATLKSNYLKVNPKNFSEYILKTLNNPTNIWKNEYYHRIKAEDRAFLMTLYSLTDTTINYNTLKKCFSKRLTQMSFVDATLNNFESVLARLNKSIIKVVDNKGERLIGVINPSVNDFLKQEFSNTDSVIHEVRKAAIHFLQFERCYDSSEISHVIAAMLHDGTVLNIDFSSKARKDYFIVSQLCSNGLLDVKYKETVYDYLQNSFDSEKSEEGLLSHNKILEKLLTKEFSDFYDIQNILTVSVIEHLLSSLDLENLVLTINTLHKYFEASDLIFNSNFEAIFEKALRNAIDDYIDYTDVSNYCDGYDINNILNEHIQYYKHGVEVDEEATVEIILNMVIKDVSDEITSILSNLHNKKTSCIKIPDIRIEEEEIASIVRAYFEPDIDEDYFVDSYRESNAISNEYKDDIDIIFDR